MTPFGVRLRELREKKGVSQKEMAAGIGVSAAYLSALEHGRRGTPSWPMLQKILGYFNVIWDEAEELSQLANASDPRVIVDTSGLSPKATKFANLIAKHNKKLNEAKLTDFIAQIQDYTVLKR